MSDSVCTRKVVGIGVDTVATGGSVIQSPLGSRSARATSASSDAPGADPEVGSVASSFRRRNRRIASSLLSVLLLRQFVQAVVDLGDLLHERLPAQVLQIDELLMAPVEVVRHVRDLL